MRIHQFCKSLLLIVAIILLSACKSTPKLQINAMTEQQKQQYIQDLSHWSFTGKIAIIPKEKRYGKKQSATLHWLQQASSFEINVNTILGINILSLESTGSGAKLSYDGEEYIGKSAEQLINQHARLSLPVTYLPTWLKGIAVNTPYTQLKTTNTNRIQSLTFYDHFAKQWTLDITNYQLVYGLSLPKKLIIENEQFKIRLIINQWHLNDE